MDLDLKFENGGIEHEKLISLCLAMTMLLGSMVGCGKTPTSSSGNPSNSEGGGLGTPQTFKFGLTVASTHPYSIAAQNFAELVEEKSGGNMTVDLYYDSSLGDDAALMESMQMNAVTFALVGPAGIAPMCPIYEFFDLPCLFATRDAAYAFQESEPVLELMDSLSANGLRGLGFYENGYYAISNNAKEITTVDGLNNLKLRSMTSEMAIKSWECLNVQPVAMAFGELFMAIQNRGLTLYYVTTNNCSSIRCVIKRKFHIYCSFKFRFIGRILLKP